MKAAWNKIPALRDVMAAEETCWINPKQEPFDAVRESLPVNPAEVDDAAARLDRFAPLLMRLFPETAAWAPPPGGVSPAGRRRDSQK